MSGFEKCCWGAPEGFLGTNFYAASVALDPTNCMCATAQHGVTVSKWIYEDKAMPGLVPAWHLLSACHFDTSPELWSGAARSPHSR